MKKQIHNQDLFENFGIEIVSVSSFIEKVNDLKAGLEGSNEELFFRGQKSEFWDVRPSAFRDDFLSVEHILMQVPLLKAPYEFVTMSNEFEIMTKYQHYGMSTRLLDLTTNPLVALYFACEKHGEVPYADYPRDVNMGEIETDKNYEHEESNLQEPCGVIFYNTKYPTSISEDNIKIVSALAHMDLSKDNTLENVLDKLEQRKIISSALKERWSKQENYSDFVDIIQSNYVVSAPYNNERLSRQCGMFLLASCFNFNYTGILGESTIEKRCIDLREEFDPIFFYVPGEKKEAILAELDFYNINEATLFPELEHQLSYIKYKSSSTTSSVSQFVKYIPGEYEASKNEIQSDLIKLADNVIENHAFESNVRKFLADKNYGFDTDKIWEEVKKWVSEVDWANQTSKLSKFKMNVKRVMADNGIDKTYAEGEAEKISEKIIQIASELS